jgi:hypothetical protein
VHLNRKTSQVFCAYAVASAVTVTCVVLLGLTADWSRFQTLVLLIGCLLVVWAIVDPDAPRRVIVLPPTGEATPHHEAHDCNHTPSIRELLHRQSKKHAG